MTMATRVRASRFSERGRVLSLLGASALVAAGSAIAQSQTATCAGEATTGFQALGMLFGYFLTYSIRYGSKTQDVFKSFLGAIGAGGGAATTLLVSEACRFPLLVSYGIGTVYGFAAFFVIAFFLAWAYSVTFDPDKVPTKAALFAETLAKVLLGEDFRPPPVKK